MAAAAVYSKATVLFDAATSVLSWAHVAMFCAIFLSCNNLTKGWRYLFYIG